MMIIIHMMDKMALWSNCQLIFMTTLSLICTINAGPVPYKEYYFDQTLDHFNFYSAQYGKSTFKQRILLQDKWWKKGSGPIFFYTGNEGDITEFWDNTGFMFDIAPKYQALVMFAEHENKIPVDVPLILHCLGIIISLLSSTVVLDNIPNRDKMPNFVAFEGKWEKWGCIIWMTLLAMLSTLDVALDWASFVKLSSPKMHYGIKLGPPSEQLLTLLLVFNIFGSLMYIVEILNLVSILFSPERYPRFFVAVEQVLVLLFEEIPLSSINLVIVKDCRGWHTLPIQIAAGIFGILNVAFRLHVYGAVEVKKNFKGSKKKMNLKLAFYAIGMLCHLALIIVLTITWRTSRVPELKPEKTEPNVEWLSGKSIFLLNSKKFDATYRSNQVHDKDISDIFGINGFNVTQFALINNASFIAEAGPGGISTNFHCSGWLVPNECTSYDYLKFNFMYIDHAPTAYAPAGEILYNFAAIKQNSYVNTTKCTANRKALVGGWQLYYLSWNIDGARVVVNSAWPEICSAPYPSHTPDMPVCQ